MSLLKKMTREEKQIHLILFGLPTFILSLLALGFILAQVPKCFPTLGTPLKILFYGIGAVLLTICLVTAATTMYVTGKSLLEDEKKQDRTPNE